MSAIKYIEKNHTASNFITARAAISKLLRGISCRNYVSPSVRPSVRPSITHMLCDKTRQCTAGILISHERAITLVIWRQQWFVDDAYFRLKFALKVTHPFRNTPTSTDFCIIRMRFQDWKRLKEYTR